MHADVVGVVMGGKDRDELQVFLGEIVEHRLRVAGIDDRDSGAASQRPDVVVPEGGNGVDLNAILLGHTAIIGDAAGDLIRLV